MSAFDLILRRRNAADNGSEEVIVPASQLSRIGFNFLKDVSTRALGMTAAAVATAGAGTYTAANILTGAVERDCAGSARTDTTDTAANILAAFQAVGLLNYDYEEAFFFVKNTTAGNFTITLAGGTGVTLQGALTIAQNAANKFALLRTSATTLVLRQA